MVVGRRGVYDEVLVRVDGPVAHLVERTALADLEFTERAHLQEWLLANPQVLGPGLEVVTTEFDRWQSAAGDAVLDRLDILAIGRDGRLVVVELKRGPAPHTVHMQAINYAAMVSRLTPKDVAELYAAYRTRLGTSTDPGSALTVLTTDFLMTAETLRRPRIVLVASDFPPVVTAAVVWLNEQAVDLSLTRFRTYQLPDGQVVVSFSRLFPVPDVEEFTIGRRGETPDAEATGESVPWDEQGLRRMAETGNSATIAVLDLTALAAPGGVDVGVRDIAEHAGITLGAVRGQLAGLTMVLKNPDYGFAQSEKPFTVQWLSGGYASYSLDPVLAALWREIRGLDPATDPGPEPDDASAIGR